MELCAIRDEDRFVCFGDGGSVAIVLGEEGEGDVVACTEDNTVDICE